MKRQILRILPLLLIALVVGWSPVQADSDNATKTFTIKIINRSNTVFQLKLKGKQIYTYEVARESSSQKKVQKGDYSYFYEVCDGDFAGNVTIDDNDTVFEIYACNLQPIPTKFVVENHIDESIKVDMNGPLQVAELTKDKSYNVVLGNNRFDIDSGDYVYSYQACDTTFSGSIRIAKNGKTKLRIYSCEAVVRQAFIAEFGALNPAKFRIANRFAVEIDITLVGPQSYFIHAASGMSRHQIVAGTYNYVFAAFGLRYEGIIQVSPNGDTILTIPFSVSSNEKV